MSEQDKAKLVDDLEEAFADSMLWNCMKRRAMAVDFVDDIINAADSSREGVEEYAEAVSLFLTYIKRADTEDYCKQFDVVEKLTESILDRLDKHRSEQ